MSSPERLGWEEGLRAELARLDLRLRERAGWLRSRREKLRSFLAERVGELRPLRRLTAVELRAWLGERPLVGVDGSSNVVGGSYPHYVALLAALAQSTDGRQTWSWQVWSPLLTEERLGQDSDEIARRQALTVLEAGVAARALSEFHPRLLLMDGPLVRFRIEAPQPWEDLSRLARQEGAVLVGVIESVGTALLASLLAEELPPSWRTAYDRELLWGLLEPGEMLVVQPPHKPGLRTCFLRPGSDPTPVGLDFPALLPWEGPGKAYSDVVRVAEVLYTLTPAGGRGVPLWLDLVDARVRLNDRMARALVEGGLSRETWWQFLASKREARPF